MVPRAALVDRLSADRDHGLLLVSAPAGYGKTTVLAQWSARQRRDVAWLSLERHHNDPAALLFDAASALRRVDALDQDVVDSLRKPAMSMSTALARLTPSIARGQAITMVLDQVEAIENPEALDVIGELAMCLPDESWLALGSRSQVPLNTPLLRSNGSLVEVGMAELAMDRAEAELLLAAAGAQLSGEEIDHLVDRTEGWPAGLYLAALAARLAPSQQAAFDVRGDERHISDYLRGEVLARLDPDTVTFLTRTAVLDSLSGPLCDHLLDRRGSQQVLESIEASNLLVVPLDRHRAWFRYHGLLRDLLVADLRRNDPALARQLHGRAAQWYAENRMPEVAIGHAQEADDPDLVAELLVVAGQPAYASGRVTTARNWLEWFQTDNRIDHYPQVAVLGGLLESLQGQPARAERWALAAERGPRDTRWADGSAPEGLRAFLRAMNTRSGTAQMRADAQLALADLGPGSPFRAGALLLEAMSHLLDGDIETADPILTRAADAGIYLRGLPAAACAIAQRALIALARGDVEQATSLAEQSMSLVAENHLDDYLEATLAYVASARLAVVAGDPATARVLAGRAARLRPLLTYAVPWSAQFLLELSKLYLAIADPSGARSVLLGVRDILQQRPDLGIVADEAARLRAELEATKEGSVAASSLTLAELRVLPYLTTHLSFREIGERLFVSRHTIKTQAIAIYRKLGVSTRSEAIVRAREVGLLVE